MKTGKTVQAERAAHTKQVHTLESELESESASHTTHAAHLENVIRYMWNAVNAGKTWSEIWHGAPVEIRTTMQEVVDRKVDVSAPVAPLVTRNG